MSHVARKGANYIQSIECFHADSALNRSTFVPAIDICSAPDLALDVRIAPDIGIALFESVEDICSDLYAVGFKHSFLEVIKNFLVFFYDDMMWVMVYHLLLLTPEGLRSEADLKPENFAKPPDEKSYEKSSKKDKLNASDNQSY